MPRKNRVNNEVKGASAGCSKFRWRKLPLDVKDKGRDQYM
jgi:hypothetical protein